MSEKNYVEVLIDGMVFTLAGTEDEGYLRRVAAYLNEKIGEVKRVPGFTRMNADYQTLMVQLNLTDDYFKEQERADTLESQKGILEKEAYSLKHELITTQMKLESLEKELKAVQEKKNQESVPEGADSKTVSHAESGKKGRR